MNNLCRLLLLLVGLVNTATARPNIVFIYTDDQAPRAVNAAGDKRFITPNIDRIFHEGAHLANAFVTTPVCSPSRAGLIASRYSSEINITDWINPRAEKTLGLAVATPTWPQRLVQAGYPLARHPRLRQHYAGLLERPAFARETKLGGVPGALLGAYRFSRRLRGRTLASVC